ncbi:hypothetical protein GCM10009830_30050 [Glycomyces endophyticus]|uniref:Uncharacterized protein n=1 Tax=Glycomyces endophyticus TaxID=480996 RepID=A0ABP4T1V6_9ACTN
MVLVVALVICALIIWIVIAAARTGKTSRGSGSAGYYSDGSSYSWSSSDSGSSNDCGPSDSGGGGGDSGGGGGCD